MSGSKWSRPSSHVSPAVSRNMLRGGGRSPPCQFCVSQFSLSQEPSVFCIPSLTLSSSPLFWYLSLILHALPPASPDIICLCLQPCLCSAVSLPLSLSLSHTLPFVRLLSLLCLSHTVSLADLLRPRSKAPKPSGDSSRYSATPMIESAPPEEHVAPSSVGWGGGGGERIARIVDFGACEEEVAHRSWRR